MNLRASLVVLMLGAVLCQVLVPLVATEVAEQYPEVAHLATPYSVVAIVAVACAQTVLIVVWRLLGMVASDQIFAAPAALRWVDAAVVAIALATILAAGILVHMIMIEGTGGPAALFSLTGATALGIALTLLMAVMRRLLVSATAYRHELDEVI